MDIYEIVKKYDEMQRNLSYPQKPEKPNEKDFSSHAAYGESLDLWEDDKSKWLEQVRQYNQTCAGISKKFKDALLSELGIKNHPKAERLWEIAWEDGHSNGYSEVAIEAEKLAELLQ